MNLRFTIQRSISFAVVIITNLAALTNAQEIDFNRDVVPILKAKCYRCHGDQEQKGDFRIDRQSDAENYIEAEDHEFSELYLMMINEGEYSQMPPKEEPQLTASELAVIRIWINEGAKWGEDTKWSDEEGADGDGDKDAKKPGFWQSLWNEVGVLHPALVHFPVALLTVAGLFSLLALRGSLVMSDIAYACLWLGAIGGLLASVVGLSYLPDRGYADLFDFDQKEYWDKSWVWHGWGGIASSAFGFILALVAAGYRRSDPEGGAIWKLGAILLAALIGFVGHLGGKIQYGSDHYDDLLKAIGIVQEDDAENDQDKKPDDSTDNSNNNDSADDKGQNEQDNENKTNENQDDTNNNGG